jgi:type II secretory pathway pseudopilin PulG
MDIHKPKPWRGLREFLKEYVIIVVGVLTALAGEQAVEAIHHREQVEQTRTALRAEMTLMATTALSVQQSDRCFLTVLGEYDAWARGGSKPGPWFPDTARGGGSVWEEARAGGVVGYMDIRERLAFSRFYGQVQNQSSLVDIKREFARHLGGFLNLDALDQASAQALLRETGGNRGLIRVMIFNADQIVALARQLGATPRAPSAAAEQRLDALCQEAARWSSTQAGKGR